jgi:hypothetical protein
MMAATTSKRGRMIWGLSLHGWEEVMRGSLAVVGVAGLLVGLATYFVVSLTREEVEESKKQSQQLTKDVAEANAGAAKANAEIANSNARAKEAEANLEKLRVQTSPRSLDSAAFIKALEGKPTGRVIVAFIQGNEEAFSLASQFTRALKTANWEVSEPTPAAAHELAKSVSRPEALSDAAPVGVTLVVRVESDEEAMRFELMNRMSMFPGGGAKTPFTALIGAMKIRGGGWTTIFAARPDQFAAPPRGTIGLIIGPKM